MTNDELDHIEARLAVVLPAEYRRFVWDYPSEVDAGTRSCEIYDRPDRVIAETETLRMGLTDLKPSPSHIIVGDTGCGDWYFLDLDESPAPVKMWDHETGKTEQVALSIDDWYAKIQSWDL